MIYNQVKVQHIIAVPEGATHFIDADGTPKKDSVWLKKAETDNPPNWYWFSKVTQSWEFLSGNSTPDNLHRLSDFII